MKFTKKVLALLLCLVMTVAAFAVAVSAADGAPNVSMTVTATEVNVGDTVTVTVSYSYMTVSSIGTYVKFDKDLLNCESVVGPYASYGADYERYFFVTKANVPAMMATVTTDVVSTADEANAAGQAGFTLIGTADVAYAAQDIFTITFTAKAAGTVTFTLVEDSEGADGYKATAETATLTIMDATPACTHENAKPVSNNDGGTHNVICQNTGCGATVSENVACSGGAASCTAKAVCTACGQSYGSLADHAFNSKASSELASAADCVNAATYYVQCDNCTEVDTTKTVAVGEAKGHGHTNSICYADINGRTHDVVCGDCGATTQEDVNHSYEINPHECVCGYKKEYYVEMHFNGGSSDIYSESTYYGFTTTAEYFYWARETLTVWGTTDYIARDGYTFAGWTTVKDDRNTMVDVANWAPTADETILYALWDAVTGWVEVDDAYYYFTNGVPATGLTRVPYPTVAINDITYGPNAEDIAYAESKGETFMDETSALFYFDENGKFVYDANGAISHGDSQGKLVSGVLVWHPGFVEVAPGEFRYFVGDPVNGGNKLAQGLIYVTRNAVAGGYNKGDLLYFVDGKVDASKNGIVELGEVKYFFENGKLACCKGLIEIEEGKYIYVRSNGELAKGQYYLPADLELSSGLYQIDENGYIIDPIYSDKNGIVDGYYYEDGRLSYAGLIEIDGDIYYVNSSGEVVTGKYYITKTNGMDGFYAGMKLVFGEDGKLEPVKDGFVEEGGKTYYYVDNHLMYGLGLHQIGEDIYYIRSSGEVVTGYFYITNTNGIEGFNAGDKCLFDDSGKLIYNFGN